MGFGSRAFLAGGLGFAAAFVVACGGSGSLLTQNESSTLAAQLTSVSDALASGSCNDVVNRSNALINSVNNLQGKDPTLQSNLTQGAAQVKEQASKECLQGQAQTSTTKSTPTTKTFTQTSISIPTQTTTTTTTVPPPTTTTTTTTTTGTGTATVPSGGVSPGGTPTAQGQGQGQ